MNQSIPTTLVKSPEATAGSGLIAMRAQVIHELIASRRSIRKFKPLAIEEHKLTRILESTRLAPSARNFQPWHYIVVTDATVRTQLRRAYDREWFYSAPVIICACGQPSRNPQRPEARDYRDIDVTISLDHLILAATAEGLGTCWIGAFDPLAVKDVLKIPDGIEPILLTPLGYPDESPAPRERRSFADVFHRNGWTHGKAQ